MSKRDPMAGDWESWILLGDFEYVSKQEAEARLAEAEADAERLSAAIPEFVYLSDFGNGEEVCYCSDDWFEDNPAKEAVRHSPRCIQAREVLVAHEARKVAE